MKMLIVPFLFLLAVVATGCATVQLSPQQRRSLQVKHFEHSYNNVFRAFKSVLQDEGYIIKNQDMQGGLIVAHASKASSTGMVVLAAIAGQQNYHTGSTFEVSVNLEEVRKNHVESRVIIQKVDAYSMGGSRGREILDPKLYRNIYSKVMVEVARRSAHKK